MPAIFSYFSPILSMSSFPLFSSVQLTVIYKIAVLENLRRILSRKRSLVKIVLKTMKWEMLQRELLYAFLRVSHCHFSVVRAVVVGELAQKPRDL